MLIRHRQYPRLNLMLRAPVEIENLLPYDLKFRIHDKNTGLSSSNFLVKGGSSPVHTVELGHLLLLSVAPEDTSESTLRRGACMLTPRRSETERVRDHQYGRPGVASRRPFPPRGRG